MKPINPRTKQLIIEILYLVIGTFTILAAVALLGGMEQEILTVNH